MSNILNSDDFGLKLYNRFPPKYREDDVAQGFALKRYLQALSDGGFKYSIDEINGITHLIDPDKIDAKVLPVLFKQYGLDIFNGIPEEYLRYLLPRLGEAWSKKGSLSVVEFITSSLSGTKTTTEVSYDNENNPTITVILEMDYNIGDYFPEAEQFNRLLRSFVPFYCDLNLLYSYVFFEVQTLTERIEKEHLVINDKIIDSGKVSSTEKDIVSIGMTPVLDTSVLKGVISKLDSVIIHNTKESGIFSKDCDCENYYITNITKENGVFSLNSEDYCKNSMKAKYSESGYIESSMDNSSLTNIGYCVLNSGFYTNNTKGYDAITINGETEFVFN